MGTRGPGRPKKSDKKRPRPLRLYDRQWAELVRRAEGQPMQDYLERKLGVISLREVKSDA